MTIQLQEFKFGWKALNAALNNIVAAVNSNMPLPGDHISLDERGTLGVSINVSGQTHSGDTDTQSSIGPVVWNGVAWKEVTLVDPVTCAQTTAVILVQSAGGQITIE